MAKKGAAKKRTAKVAQPKSVAARTRLRKITKRQQRQLAKKEARVTKKLPSSYSLVSRSVKLFLDNWQKLLGILVVYLVLNIIFASGFGTISSNINNIKDNISIAGGHNFSAALGSYGSLIASAGTSSSQTGAVLEALLIIIESLVIIWALRQIFAKTNFSVKEAYYRSTGTLIPFILVIAVLIIQLLPVILGSAIVQAILSAIFNSSGTLTFVFTLFFLVLAGWSLYMLSGSLFGLYIVTLPDMQPLQALRSAKSLVKYRRWPVLRKILFLIFFIFLITGIIVIPLILFATVTAAPVFYILSMLSLLFAHTYLYSLYRSLLA